MPTIDLASVPAAEPVPRHATAGDGGALAAAPRRIGLTLAELQHAARLAGDAPLPFEVAAPPTADAMQARLGQSPASLDDEAFRTAVRALHDPADSLERRGLTVDGVLEPGLAGAIGLLASPRFALDVDLTMGGVQAKVWHRQGGSAVASLATVDAIVFELGWFGTDAWAAELARVADGAMGRVFEGRHPETKARVAIKVLHANVARDEVAAQRFTREFETTAELQHPHRAEIAERQGAASQEPHRPRRGQT